MGWHLDWIEMRKWTKHKPFSLSASVCRYNVSSCLKFLLPWHPHHCRRYIPEEWSPKKPALQPVCSYQVFCHSKRQVTGIDPSHLSVLLRGHGMRCALVHALKPQCPKAVLFYAISLAPLVLHSYLTIIGSPFHWWENWGSGRTKAFPTTRFLSHTS